MSLYEPRNYDGESAIVKEILRLTDSDTVEVTPRQQQGVTCSIIINASLKKKSSGKQDSACFQWLKQLWATFDVPEDNSTAVFVWVNMVMNYSETMSLEILRYTIRIVLALGADIYARWYQLFPLQYLFHRYWQINADGEELPNIVDIVTVLLENEADLFALDDHGNSVFDMAENTGLTPELSIAVQRVGYGLDKVIDKIKHLQWCFNNPNCGIADSTSIDKAQIAPPCTAGLVSRRPIINDTLDKR